VEGEEKGGKRSHDPVLTKVGVLASKRERKNHFSGVPTEKKERGRRKRTKGFPIVRNPVDRPSNKARFLRSQKMLKRRGRIEERRMALDTNREERSTHYIPPGIFFSLFRGERRGDLREEGTQTKGVDKSLKNKRGRRRRWVDIQGERP